MKRINLNVDLKENEIFDKEITDVIKSRVREIAREEKEDFIRKEVEHELKRLMEGWGYRDRLKSMNKDRVWDAVKEIVKLEDIQTLTEKKVEEKLDYFVNRAVEKAGKICDDTIKNSISEKVEEKLKNIPLTIEVKPVK